MKTILETVRFFLREMEKSDFEALKSVLVTKASCSTALTALMTPGAAPGSAGTGTAILRTASACRPSV